MDILYRANDGTIFNEEWDCEQYEEKLILLQLGIDKIRFFDENGKEYLIKKEAIFDDNYYYDCVKIIVENEKQLKALQRLASYCGWCEFEEQITSPGIWIRQESNDYAHRYEGYWKKVN